MTIVSACQEKIKLTVRLVACFESKTFDKNRNKRVQFLDFFLTRGVNEHARIWFIVIWEITLANIIRHHALTQLSKAHAKWEY